MESQTIFEKAMNEAITPINLGVRQDLSNAVAPLLSLKPISMQGMYFIGDRFYKYRPENHEDAYRFSIMLYVFGIPKDHKSIKILRREYNHLKIPFVYPPLDDRIDDAKEYYESMQLYRKMEPKLKECRHWPKQFLLQLSGGSGGSYGT